MWPNPQFPADCNEMGIINIDLNNVNLDNNFYEGDYRCQQ